MTALAASDDVEAVLGRTLTADETAKLDATLAAASATVRDLTGRKYEAGTYTVRRRVRGGKVRLDNPATVTGVVAVDSDGNETAVTGTTLRGDALYGLAGRTWVEITYTTLGTVPAELVNVTAAMAARDLTDETPAGASSYTITNGPFTESASFNTPTESIEPSPSEARIIRRYALPRPGILLSARARP